MTTPLSNSAYTRSEHLRALWPWLPLWTAMALLAIFAHGPMPMFSTRTLAVAWEMWAHGHWLVPHINGEPYSEKVPLLFWMIHAGWAVFGVNDVWPRVLEVIFGGTQLVLASLLASRLFPARPWVAKATPWLLMALAYSFLFGLQIMYEVLLVVWVLAALLCLTPTATRAEPRWWLFGVIVGAGLLTHLVGHLGTGVGSEDLLAQHVKAIQRDRDHAEDEEYQNAGQYVERRFVHQSRNDENGYAGEQELADGHHRPPRVASGDADTVDQCVADGQRWQVRSLAGRQGDGADEAGHECIAERADLEGDFENTLVGSRIARQPHGSDHTRNRDEDQHAGENLDGRIARDDSGGNSRGNAAERAKGEAGRLRVERPDQLAPYELVPVVPGKVILEDVIQALDRTAPRRRGSSAIRSLIG